LIKRTERPEEEKRSAEGRGKKLYRGRRNFHKLEAGAARWGWWRVVVVVVLL
jgi:hypothetical protein